MKIIEINDIQYNLDVVIKTDNTENNILFCWQLNDIDMSYVDNGIIDGVKGVDEYEYIELYLKNEK